MNVSDLLQDSPSQHRRRPPLQHDSPPPTQSTPTSLPPTSTSPSSQQPQQHSHSHQHPSHPPPAPQPSYPPQPSQYYQPHPFSRPDPAPMHRITPRPPSQIHQPHIDATPAMASLQHPTPSAPPPHLHPPTAPWGPPTSARQGSSPLSVSNLAPGSASLHVRTHHQQPQQQIKPAIPGSERSPVVQRAHTSGSSTPSNIAAHSPSSKPLLTTPAGVLILDNRSADEQIARPASQVQPPMHGPSSTHPNNSPGTSFKSGRDREKEWDQRQQEDMDFIRHAARERVVGPFDRDRDRALPSPRDRSLASPHERPLPSPHDRQITHDRPIPSPHERERPPNIMHRMSPLARSTPTQPPPPLRPPASTQQSPPGPSHRALVGPPVHDRMPPPNDRDRMPPTHERPPHDRDRIHPTPFSHPIRQGPPLLPGQGQFQTHPPEWDPVRDRERDLLGLRERDIRDIPALRERDIRERDVLVLRERDLRDIPALHERDLRERDMPVLRERDLRENIGPPRDLPRERDLDPTRDPEYGFRHDHDRAYPRERDRRRLGEPPREPNILLPQRERDAVPPGQRDVAMQRDRETHSAREREKITERERELASMESMSMPQREREMHMQQRERDRLVGSFRDGETGPGVLPRSHDRERDRERRPHSRMPSPHGMNISAGVSPLPGTTMTGPGGPGPHHPPPSVHDHHFRERELQLANERERQFAWERERDRDIDRRQYRERMPASDRDNERIAMTERERAVTDRDRIYERDRMAFSDRERIYSERERMERERMAERVMHERVMHEREREQRVLDHEKVNLERSGDPERTPMRSHPFDMVERDRVEAFERERVRERLEATERDRDRVLEATSTSVPGASREGDQDRKAFDMPVVEHERDERPVGPSMDRELMERHERERLEHEHNTVTDRDQLMHATGREAEHTQAERERLETRERLEILQREISELLERDRVAGLDIMDRERLGRLERESVELIERERLEILERERLEMLERMPSAEELAKARKERERKPFVSLGTYVWPRTPFPYYFPEWIPTPIVKEDKPFEDDSLKAGPSSSSLVPPLPIPDITQIPTELRLTVLVPPSFLPPARPQKFRLWGGGLPPPPPFPYTPSIYSYSRRRVYTDDSDVIQCAVHAGLLTWSGITRAKKEGRTIRVVLALVPTLASASGAVKGGQSESRVSMDSTSANGHMNGTASVPRTRTNTPLPPPASSAPSTSSVNEPQPPGYAGGVWASRFIGGWGEAFYGEDSAGRGDSAGRMTSFEEAEDDGRGCVSCGWGWGHDGSAFEVISVDVVEPKAHVAPGLGIRNRAQRLAEYAQRRTDMFGLAPPPSPPLLDVTNTPKRRRLNVDFTEMKKAGLSEAAAIAEEAKKMQAMTISFGIPDRKKSKTGVGFKYDAQVIQGVLLSHLHQGVNVRPPPSKRRKIAVREAQAEEDMETDPAEDTQRGVVLESLSETYVVTWGANEDSKTRYTLSVLGPPAEVGMSPSASLPRPRSIPPSDATPKPGDADARAMLSGSDEGQEVLTDEPSSAKSTESQGSPSKNKATDASPPPASPSTVRPPSMNRTPTPIPTPTVRVLRSDVLDTDFMFEKDAIVVKGRDGDGDDAKMVVDGEDGHAVFRMRVTRWRWYAWP